MNDEFMHDFYEAPRPEFGNALYERISKEPPSRVTQIFLNNRTFRNAAIAFVFLFLIAAGVYVASESRWDKVGDIWVKVERRYKVEVISSLELPGEPGIQYEEPECLTVKEARQISRFDFQVPAWAPDGFHVDDKICGINRMSDYASLYWEGKDPYSGINLWISNRRGFNMATQKYEIWPAAIWQPVAPGSYKAVQVHGQSAVLVRGDWDLPPVVYEVPPGREPDANGQIEAKWDSKKAVQLHWVDGDIMYSLYAGTNVSAEDLIKMAESAR